MKKTSTLFTAMICAGFLAGQGQNFSRPGSVHQIAPAKIRPAATGFETGAIEQQHVSVPPSQSVLRTTDEIGFTFYDLQANNSDNSRIINLGGGDLRAAWGFNKKAGDGGFADRGSAYSQTVSGAFPTDPSAQPKERVEAGRTGFPSFVMTDNGTEMVISHRTNGTGKYLIHFAKRPAGGGAWTEGDLPTSAPNGLLWARAAASGSKIHVIAITSVIATNVGGVKVNGIDGEVRYFRSSDNGATWDKTDILLPGLDSTVLRAHGAESYSIDADGDNVAIGVFPAYSDISFWKSTDGGNSFSKHTIYKVPLKNFVPGDGYVLADIDTAFSSKALTTTGIDSLSVWGCDQNGSIKVDALGKAHVLFGGGFINASAANTTGAYNYYPSSGGINYWNESMPEDTNELDGFPNGLFIAEAIDHDNSGGIEVVGTQYNSYGGCFMASQPTMGFGADPNTMFVAYISPDERYFSTDDIAYSHVNIIRTNDGGANWDGPYDLNNTENMDEVEIPITETAFPFLAKNCEDKIHLLFMQDNIPGSFVTDNAGAAPSGDDLSLIKYLGLDPNLVVPSKETVRPAAISMKMMPNPASEFLTVELSFLKKTDRALVSVLDMNGRLVFQENRADMQFGRTTVPVAQLPNGVYSLTVRTESGVESRKFSVVH